MAIDMTQILFWSCFFLPFVHESVVHAIVISKNDIERSAEPTIVDLTQENYLEDVLQRVKRGVPKPGSATPNNNNKLTAIHGLKRVVHDLDCQRHNEAVVHWCGDKSQVRYCSSSFSALRFNMLILL